MKKNIMWLKLSGERIMGAYEMGIIIAVCADKLLPHPWRDE